MANPIAPTPASGAGASQDQAKTQAQPAPKKEQKGQGQQDAGQGERQRRADGTFAPAPAPGPNTSAATAADTTQGSGILGGPIRMGGLPGVMDDGETGEREELAKAGAADGLGAAPGPQGEPPAAATPAPAARPIKPIPDKITAAAATTQAQAAQPQHRVEGDETGQPEPAEPTEKFILAGEEFESREQAEQNIRVLRGHYKKYKEQADAGARAVQQFEQLRPEYDRIVQYAQELEQRLRQSPSPVQPQPQPANANLPASGPQRQPATSPGSPGGQPPAGASSGPLTAEGLLDSAVDWKMIGTAAQQHGPVVATYLALEGVVGKLLDHFNADVDRRLDARVAPLQHTHDALQVTSSVSNLWSQMRDMVYTDGSPAYPEFDDPAAATQIGRIWMSLRIPIEEKMTVRGAHMAIALYRDQMSRAGAAGTASGNGAGQVNGNGSNSLPTTAELIAQLGPVGAIAREIVQDVVGAQSANPVAAPGSQQVRADHNPLTARASRVKKALRESGAHDSLLGFSE